MIKAMLLEGRSVQYKSTGNSLWPWVHSGDCCIFEPVFDCGTLIAEHDVVFCEVQPGDRFFAHKRLRVEYEDESSSSAASAQTPRRKFYIGNMSKHENGWCYDEHIYGRLVEVLMGYQPEYGCISLRLVLGLYQPATCSGRGCISLVGTRNKTNTKTKKK